MVFDRICWISQSGDDLLSKQPLADTLHDTRIPQHAIQVCMFIKVTTTNFLFHKSDYKNYFTLFLYAIPETTFSLYLLSMTPYSSHT